MTILSRIVTLFLCTMAMVELTSPVNRRFFFGNKITAAILAFEYLLLTYIPINFLTHPHTWQAILASASLAVVSDFAAFVTGKFLGRHKVAALRRISPNKSWEGYASGLLTGLVFAHLLRMELIFATITILAAMCGDLASSAIKRAYGIKDFNDLVKNRPIVKVLGFPVARCGGYMDRMDSISFALLVLIIRSYF